jgi:integral membrane sensor domain MASE1
LVVKQKSTYVPLGLFLGGFFEALINLNTNYELDFLLLFSTAFLVGFSYLIVFLLGAYLIRNKFDKTGILSSPYNSLKFLIFAIFISFFVAILGIISLTICGFLSWITFGENLLSWSIGDLGAIMIFSIPILIWDKENLKINQKGKIELGLFMGCSILFQYIIFLKPHPKFHLFLMPYLLIPILIWAAFRIPAELSFINMIVLSLTSTIGTSLGSSPFNLENANISLIQVQLFIIIISITNLFLVATITMQKNTQAKLRQYSIRLEHNVKEGQEGIKILSGLLPICAKCKRIRDVKTNNWQMLEEYIGLHSDASFTHGFCPDCLEKFEKEFENEIEKMNT